eukprot:6178664-Prorocentrum_lima.AAC.1
MSNKFLHVDAWRISRCELSGNMSFATFVCSRLTPGLFVSPMLDVGSTDAWLRGRSGGPSLVSRL